jgi:hypothetical protein
MISTSMRDPCGGGYPISGADRCARICATPCLAATHAAKLASRLQIVWAAWPDAPQPNRWSPPKYQGTRKVSSRVSPVVPVAWNHLIQNQNDRDSRMVQFQGEILLLRRKLMAGAASVASAPTCDPKGLRSACSHRTMPVNAHSCTRLIAFSIAPMPPFAGDRLNLDRGSHRPPFYPPGPKRQLLGIWFTLGRAVTAKGPPRRSCDGQKRMDCVAESGVEIAIDAPIFRNRS